ncbi:MAG: RIP metalloprotease RseP [Clostridium sp.]|uniref:RIP metalloprotease RseP n=1 Tax=Clostridium sp. TaxID=1506 RepID=UPI0025BF559B|nr:RIP metalloprotease RseP [Clostridium sp.]MCH3963989.1 RIP metalloprotease RseP [Clostridium sp.]MCI1716190.1 RIP metalloprotease RseP [Clostridium sp.]MCI1800570.1 RIP metalloprotease RseP [Clostridium sp.]MCI1814367.1 RIP metalloprotease RseP [Clostridium sp.]MCI1871266.1 RIP metalloprotease RseP [Clostridium sp.]
MYIIAAILAFGLLILIHELGHFTLAKINGVKVEEFAIGMGPQLVGIKGKETKYSIKLLPIGGYVKMLGEEGDSADPRAFNNKSPIRKLSIVAAGPIMNLLLGIVLFAVIASQKGYWAPIIDKTIANKPAQEVGLKAGDRIIKANNSKILTWEDFLTEVYMNGQNPVNIVYKRGDATKQVVVKPVFDKSENRYMIGAYGKQILNPGIGQSVYYGVIETRSLINQTIAFFKTLFMGKANMDNVGGPVTIIKMSGAAAKAGIFTLLAFCAYISIQLAIFNIIPFPALDGGYIFLFIFEIITGKKVDQNKVGVINYVGFAILMILMVLVTVKDVLHPVQF